MKYRVRVYYSGLVEVEVEAAYTEQALTFGRERVTQMSEGQFKDEVAQTLEPWKDCDEVEAIQEGAVTQ